MDKLLYLGEKPNASGPVWVVKLAVCYGLIAQLIAFYPCAVYCGAVIGIFDGAECMFEQLRSPVASNNMVGILS